MIYFQEINPLEQEKASEAEGGGGDSEIRIPSKILALTLGGILLSVGMTMSEEEKSKLVLDVILDAHHPLIGE